MVEKPSRPSRNPAAPVAEKATLRRELLAARRSLSPEARRAAALALSRTALELPELADARTVAAYVSVGGEPGTRELLDALRAAGKRVLLPLLLPDNDLDWAVYEGPDSLAEAAHPGKMRLLEPAGPPLGPDAVTGADAVLLPGLAVDRRGMRLGRGGARTTVCWNGWSGPGRVPRSSCSSTTKRWSRGSRRNRTTTPFRRWPPRRG